MSVKYFVLYFPEISDILMAVITMIYICTLSRPLLPKEKELLLSVLPDERRKKLQKKKQDADAALLAYAILAVKASPAPLSADAHGKPYFAENPNLCFSISHTPDAAAVGISDAPIGVDVEAANRHISDSVLRRICTEEEFARYKDAPIQNKITLWTLKESYGKYHGTGIALPLSAVSFPSLSPLTCSEKSVHLQSTVQGGFVCSAVSKHEEHFVSVTVQEIIREIQEKD